MRRVLTHAFRGYAAIAVVVAGFTGLWAIGIVDAALPVIGYAWFAVAAVGTLVAVGLTIKDDEVIEPDADPERIDEFEAATVTGPPLDAYLGALAMWAGVSFGWVLGGMSPTGLPVVGYGWLAIAGYCLILGIGIIRNHRRDVAAAVDPTESLETDQ